MCHHNPGALRVAFRALLKSFYGVLNHFLNVVNCYAGRLPGDFETPSSNLIVWSLDMAFTLTEMFIATVAKWIITN